MLESSDDSVPVDPDILCCWRSSLTGIPYIAGVPAVVGGLNVPGIPATDGFSTVAGFLLLLASFAGGVPSVSDVPAVSGVPFRLSDV